MSVFKKIRYILEGQGKTKEQKPSESVAYENSIVSVIENEPGLNRRNKLAGQFVKQLSQDRNWSEIIAFCNWYTSENGNFPKINAIRGKSELIAGSPQKAVGYLSESVEEAPTKNNLMNLFQGQKIIGDWQGAEDTINRVIQEFEQDENEPVETQFERFRASTKFIARAHEINLKTPQPIDPKGVVFLSSFACENTLGLNLLSLQLLKEKGYAVIHLSEGSILTQPTGNPTLDRFQQLIHFQKNRLRRGPHSTGRFFDWAVDWENKIVEAGGINFYQCFFERLARDLHKYSISIDEKTASYLDSLINQADVALHVVSQIDQQVVEELKLPVRFLSGSSQYIPYGIFRIYCKEKRKTGKLEFISTLIGKEFNFYNKINDISHYVSTRNVTAYGNTRMPQLPTKEGYQSWVQNNPVTSEEQAFVDRFVNYDRNLTGSVHPEGEAVLEKIRQAKNQGRKIVCVFGKVIWDFDYPYDFGPAHNSLEDWINHTISAAEKSEALFLVKPHPHEERVEIAGVPNERFLDLITETVPDNGLILEQNWLNTKDLFPYLDLGVVWAGTVELDLGINNIPVLACCDWGIKDYPVDFVAPENRNQYEDLLKYPERVAVPENCSTKCIDVLRYMSSDELFIPYSYYIRSTTNKLLLPEWIEKDLEEFFKNGDKYVEMQSRRFFDDRPETPC